MVYTQCIYLRFVAWYHFHHCECRTSKQPKVWEASRNGVKEWVFCGSALSAEEKVGSNKIVI